MNLNRGDGGLMLSTPRRGVQKLVLINPSQITACAAKVIIVSQLKCLYELRKNYALPDKVT